MGRGSLNQPPRPFLLTRAVARHWRETGTPGRVVNVASTAATLARPGTAHYAASKAGLIQLTRVMAIELAPARHPRQRRSPRA